MLVYVCVFAGRIDRLHHVVRFQPEWTIPSTKKLCFFKIGYSRPLFCLFLSFQTNFTILTTNKCEKCPSSIRCSAVFVAQLVERSLPKAEISGSNPVIGTFYLL